MEINVRDREAEQEVRNREIEPRGTKFKAHVVIGKAIKLGRVKGFKLGESICNHCLQACAIFRWLIKGGSEYAAAHAVDGPQRVVRYLLNLP